MPNLLSKTLIALGAAVSVATAANAVVLDLSSLPVGAFTGPVTVDGYTLTPRGLDSSTPTIMVVNGLKVLAAFNGGSQGDDTFLTRADGRSFTLNAVDIGLLPDYGSTGQAVSSATYSADLNGVATASPQTITFGTGFARSTSIDLDALSGAYYANIDVSGTVPEPASWMLMIAGFGLTGFAARRRTAAVA